MQRWRRSRSYSRETLVSELTRSELLCLRRTKLAADIGRREIDPSELVDFATGPHLQTKTWNSLKQRGYVANGRGISVRLTAKGAKALKEA